jgi:hypothetical protein
MIDRLPPNLVRRFVAIARTKSFRGAAERASVAISNTRFIAGRCSGNAQRLVRSLMGSLCRCNFPSGTSFDSIASYSGAINTGGSS